MQRFIILFFSLSVVVGQAQAPVAHFTFDDCSAIDIQGNYLPGEIKQNINCDCGVGSNSNAFYFNGSADTLVLDPALKTLFNSDFSLSFYYWVENTIDPYALMSVREECNKDSSLFIQYLPQTKELVVEYSRNIAEGIFFREIITQKNCWHHLLFTREGPTFALYLDGEFIASLDFLSQIELGASYEFAVGSSPCVQFTDGYFNGRIDEIMFHDYALKEEQISEILRFPDEIITQDTTIFQGDQFQVRTGGSCATSIQWVPTTGIDNPSGTNPMMSPDETSLYSVSFNHGTCVSTDSIMVSVISQNDIECNNILLPKAFTPNGDGLNDVYGISNLFAIESISRFEIYDRWGHKLFETVDKNETWDGAYNGTTMIPGVYVYKIEYTCLGDEFRKTGSFNILK